MSQLRDDADNKPTILVVDDDRGTIELIQMMLRVRGYEVLVAYSGLEAVALLKEHVKQRTFWYPLPIDLILLDIMMPGIDGFKVCQHVKDDAILKYIPVIMVTALENTSDKIAAVEFGADGYITKPFLPEELGSAIKAKLQIKRREENLLRRNAELEAINAISAATTRTLDLNRILEASFTALLKHTELAAAALYLYNDETKQLECVMQHGIDRPEILSATEGTVAKALRTQVALTLTESDIGDRLRPNAPQTTKISAYMAIPLRGVERSLGVLEIFVPRPHTLDDHEIETFSTIGDRIGGALENAQIFQHSQTLLAKSYQLGAAQT